MSVPETVYYIPNFLTKDDVVMLLEKVYNVPKPKWKNLNNRRLQNWGGLPHPKGMVLESLPPWLQTHCTKLEKEGLFSGTHINHVLVNEYKPGQGIMAHVDGPLFTPLIATLNLGSSCLLKFQTRDSDTDHLKDEFSLFLEEGSVLVQTGEVYERFLHGIEEVEEDLVSEYVANLGLCHGVSVGDVVKRGTRVSLTIRSVPKVVKFKLRL